jgi:putative ubiquitin-RnfH superfamily antitoxin RatB of RatAB toxin-antitoxin module
MMVEVAYAGVDGQTVCRVGLRQGSSVMDAIEASGIADVLPEGRIPHDRLGVFGRKVPPHQLLRDGDRVEIYRPLVFDPMDARRRRARGN